MLYCIASLPKNSVLKTESSTSAGRLLSCDSCLSLMMLVQAGWPWTCASSSRCTECA